MYVQRQHAGELEVYDTTSYTVQRRLAVPGLRSGSDIVASSKHHCTYTFPTS